MNIVLIKKAQIVFSIIFIFIISGLKGYNQPLELFNNTDSSKQVIKLLDEAKELPKESIGLKIKLAKNAFLIAKQLNNKELLIETYYFLGQQYKSTYATEDAIINYNSGLIMAKQISNDSLQAIAYLNLGVINGQQSNHDLAEQYFTKYLNVGNKISNNNIKARAYNNLGITYSNKGEMQKSFDSYNKSLKYWQELNDTVKISSCYINLGKAFYNIGDYEKALDYNFKALNLRKKHGNKKLLAHTYNNIGSIYETIGKYKEALEFHKISLKTSTENNLSIDFFANSYNNIGVVYDDLMKYDSALVYYYETLHIWEKLNNKRAIAMLLSNIASTYLSIGKTKKALKLYFQTIKLSKEANNNYQLTTIYNNVASCYIKTQQYSKALPYLNNAVKLSKQIHSYDLLSSALSMLSDVNYNLKNYKTASKYYKESTILKDSLFNIKKNSEIEKLNLIYANSERKNMEANILKEKQKRVLKIKNTIIFILILLTFLFIMLLVYILLKKKKQLQENSMFSFSRDGFNSMLAATNDGIIIFDAKGNTIIHNKKLEALWNITLKNNVKTESCLLRCIKEQIENSEIFTEQIELIKNGILFKNKLLQLNLKTGNVIEMHSAAFSRDNKVVGYFWTFRDISQRKIIEQDKIKLSNAIEHSPVSVVITNVNGDIEYVNPEFTKVSGYSKKEAIGQNPRILKSGDQSDEYYKTLWNTISSGKTWYGEFHNKKKNGELYWESVVISPISTNNKITHYVAIKNNITELKAANDKLSELIATKDRFFSIISHDLKNPFSALIGFSELMLSNFNTLSKEKMFEYVTFISKASNSGFKLLENLSLWSKSQTGKLSFSPETIRLKAAVSEVVELNTVTLKNKGINASIEIDENIRVYVDENVIKTVLRNLISNAIKFTHKKGTITINASKINDSFIEVVVKDNGVGMNNDTLNKLFKIDESITTQGTENEKGTGLGLLICKDFVVLNNGKIRVESEEGKGTTFYFTVPLTK